VPPEKKRKNYFILISLFMAGSQYVAQAVLNPWSFYLGLPSTEIAGVLRLQVCTTMPGWSIFNSVQQFINLLFFFLWSAIGSRLFCSSGGVMFPWLFVILVALCWCLCIWRRRLLYQSLKTDFFRRKPFTSQQIQRV
jgi:hypothetical protein